MFVRVVKGAGQGLDDPRGLTRWLRRTCELLLQAAAGCVLQDQVTLSFGLADLVDLDDIGMEETSRCLGFVAEAGGDLGVGVEPTADHLQRHQAVQADLRAPGTPRSSRPCRGCP